MPNPNRKEFLYSSIFHRKYENAEILFFDENRYDPQPRRSLPKLERTAATAGTVNSEKTIK
ncbi:hypothetical protein C0033_13690 [Clostridium sp. chh4-2]|nr:hypothetical protein C0033_13690 [Clostridium sp. chh4-2]